LGCSLEDQLETNDKDNTAPRSCPLPDNFYESRSKKRKSESEEEDNQKDRHGGGKNAQHGKEENLPSEENRLKELENRLKDDNLTRKEKVKIRNTIKNLTKSMDKRRSGENHSQKHKR
jgi:hypothetical protein